MKTKTLFIVLTIVSILFISTTCFATNDVKNDVSNVTNTMIDGAARLGNDVKNGINNAAGAIENGSQDLGNAVSNGMHNMENSITNNENSMGSNYNAVRTSTVDTTENGNINSNVFTWVAVAIAGIVIVGLVWYYAAEHNTER